MSNFKGTKGKWIIVKNDYYNDVMSDSNSYDNGGKIMRISTLIHEIKEDGSIVNCNFSEEDNANAKLIVCAPEMLEMLIKINTYLLEIEKTNNFKFIPETIGNKEIEQLIKKATE